MICCFLKARIMENNEVEYKNFRLLRLNQFINIYNHTKQQSEVLKQFDSNREPTAKCSNLLGSAPDFSDSIMTESKLYDT